MQRPEGMLASFTPRIVRCGRPPRSRPRAAPFPPHGRSGEPRVSGPAQRPIQPRASRPTGATTNEWPSDPWQWRPIRRSSHRTGIHRARAGVATCLPCAVRPCRCLRGIPPRTATHVPRLANGRRVHEPSVNRCVARSRESQEDCAGRPAWPLRPYESREDSTSRRLKGSASARRDCRGTADRPRGPLR